MVTGTKVCSAGVLVCVVVSDTVFLSCDEFGCGGGCNLWWL